MPVQTRRSLSQKRKAVEDGAIKEERCTIDDQCAICQESLYGTGVYHLPCGHTFHKECIERQLSAGAHWSNLCALCRTDHEDAMHQVPALRAIQNQWQRRVRRRLYVAEVTFRSPIDGNQTTTTLLGVQGGNNTDDGGETPPFFFQWADGTPVQLIGAYTNDQGEEASSGDQEAIAGPAPEAISAPEPAAGPATERAATPNSLPDLISPIEDIIDEDDWPMFDEDEEEMLAQLSGTDSVREIDYPEEEESEEEEEGIHLYNTYVPYPRGYYRFETPALPVGGQSSTDSDTNEQT